MTLSDSVNCPHCGGSNLSQSVFCQSCGKALPSLVPTGPRVVKAGEMASTAPGQRFQVDELHKQSKKASGALLAVAIIQTIVGGIIIAGQQFVASRPRAHPVSSTLQLIAIGVLVIAMIFWVLFAWSRTQPLPAAIVGLVIYSTIVLINILTSVKRLSEGGPHSGIGGIGIGWIDIVILAVLARAISAGSAHRKLVQNGVV